jgi:hypothetical protein
MMTSTWQWKWMKYVSTTKIVILIYEKRKNTHCLSVSEINQSSRNMRVPAGST